MELAVVILTYNESLHLARCLQSLRQVATAIYIVDAFSTDNTVAIAESYGATVFQRKWVNYADQFQWALEHAGITAPWIMRMDADEYLDADKERIKSAVTLLGFCLLDYPNDVCHIPKPIRHLSGQGFICWTTLPIDEWPERTIPSSWPPA